MRPNVRERLGRLFRRHTAFCNVLSLDPPIFLVSPVLDMEEEPFVSYRPLFVALAGRQSFWLCLHTWNITPHIFELLRRQEARARQDYPDLQLIQLCNEPGEAERFAAHGLRAIFCNHNCLLDERVFKPLPAVQRRFDAVYDARLVEFKRHLLAREVDRLALIYAANPADPLQDASYVARLRRELPRAHYFNHGASGGYRALEPAEVNDALNACRVGLCLSREEGAMFASAQYLLSGLPVVTTPSQGGRDVFFEEGFVTTVPPEPGAVRDAVADLAGRKLAAEEIRRATLDRMHSHRQALITLVQGIFDRQGVRRSFAEDWPRVFSGGIFRSYAHQMIVATIKAAGHSRGG